MQLLSTGSLQVWRFVSIHLPHDQKLTLAQTAADMNTLAGLLPSHQGTDLVLCNLALQVSV